MITYHALRSLPQLIRQIKDVVWLVWIKTQGVLGFLHNMGEPLWVIQRTQLNAYLEKDLRKPILFLKSDHDTYC